MSDAVNEVKPGILRTPDACFENLPGFEFAPNYVEINDYRMHYLDEGSGEAVLMLHGEPTWSYLYRKMIPPLVEAGYRTIVPDLIGFGRSDKPAEIATHSYAFHVDNISRFLVALDLHDLTLVCQDWGSLIGLRVAAENPERFARIVLANGGLPTGDHGRTDAFMKWRGAVEKMQASGYMPVGKIISRDPANPDSEPKFGPDIMAAYEAPFPNGKYMAGPLAMPLLVPISPDNPATEANRAAWEVLKQWDKPFLTAFSDGDPITAGGEKVFRKLVPGAHHDQHVTIEGAYHFLQEDRGEEFATEIIRFMKANPL